MLTVNFSITYFELFKVAGILLLIAGVAMNYLLPKYVRFTRWLIVAGFALLLMYWLPMFAYALGF